MTRRTPPRVMRLVLTRDLVVHTAVELVERDGAKALSMRAIGAELGVSAMAIYRHVAGKEALLEGIAEYVMASLDLPVGGTGDWKAGARELIGAFRSIAEEYPRSLALVLEHRVSIPVGLRAVERTLSLCAEAGLDDETSVHVMRSLMAYTLGTQLSEAGLRRQLEREAGDPIEAVRALSSGRFPHVGSLPAQLIERSDADFEFGLELFLSSIEHMGRPAG